MALKSLLRMPENAMLVGLGEAGIIYALYANAVPRATDVRSASAHNVDVEAARKQAAWQSAFLIGLVLIITNDVNSAIVGGAALAGVDLMTKHANGVNPSTGKLAGRENTPASNDIAFPLPDVSEDTDTMTDPGY